MDRVDSDLPRVLESATAVVVGFMAKKLASRGLSIHNWKSWRGPPGDGRIGRASGKPPDENWERKLI
jgi:hypothetical protein